jgi:hypothetical protein
VFWGCTWKELSLQLEHAPRRNSFWWLLTLGLRKKVQDSSRNQAHSLGSLALSLAQSATSPSPFLWFVCFFWAPHLMIPLMGYSVSSQGK